MDREMTKPQGEERAERLTELLRELESASSAPAPAPAADDAELLASEDSAREPVLPAGGTLAAALEALLLVANEPLELRDLTAVLGGCSWVPVRQALRELQRRYRDDASGFELIEVAKGWRLVTKPLYAQLVESVLVIEREERLSRAQLEVLSVIAYRQPIRRSDIDTLRGADCTAALKGLLDKGLVRVAGRADQAGRPLLYGTTRAFLEKFGLKDLNHLPQSDKP